jgi:hypothetical protein
MYSVTLEKRENGFMSRWQILFVVFLIEALLLRASPAQTFKPQPVPPIGPPGGLPGVVIPPPSLPSPSPSMPQTIPDIRPPVVVVPPPPPPKQRPQDGGGPEECECYRNLDVPIRDVQGRIVRYEQRRVPSGKSSTCCVR